MNCISRRTFLKVAAAAAATTASPNVCIFSQASKSRLSSPGIQLYMVNAELTKDPAGTLLALAAMGYKKVETAPYGGPTPIHLLPHIRAAGLEYPSAHLPFGMQDTEKVLAEAHGLGVRYVVSAFLLPQPPATGANLVDSLNRLTVDGFKRIAEKANKIGELAKAAGFRYAYHNHNFEFRDLGGGQTGYSILLSETDPHHVYFEADCGWLYAAGLNAIDYLKKYPGRYPLLHLKDIKGVRLF